MIRVDIQADSRYPLNRRMVRRVVREALQTAGMVSDMAVSVAVVGDRKMADLHKQYLGLEGTTDVMSWPYLDADSNPTKIGKRFVHPKEELRVLGDILISFPQAVEQAKQKNSLVNEELERLLRHGLDHLLGKHHE